MSVIEVDVTELERLREVERADHRRRQEIADRQRNAKRRDDRAESWYEKRQKFLDSERSRLSRSLTRNRVHDRAESYVAPYRGSQVDAYLEYAMVEWADELSAMTPARKREMRLDKKRARNGRAPRKPKVQGHPRRKHYSGDDIDPAKRPLREVVQLVRKETERADDIRDFDGVLRAAAEKAVPTLLRDFGLEDRFREPLKQWVTWRFGQVLEQPDIDGMLDWIERSKQ